MITQAFHSVDWLGSLITSSACLPRNSKNAFKEIRETLLKMQRNFFAPPRKRLSHNPPDDSVINILRQKLIFHLTAFSRIIRLSPVMGLFAISVSFFILARSIR